MKNFTISCRVWELEDEITRHISKKNAMRESISGLIDNYNTDKGHLMDWCQTLEVKNK